MQTIILPKAESDVVLNIILNIIGKCNIYVFGSREYHFYILIFSDTSISASHLMNEVAERTNRTITATVLLHKPTHLKTKQLSQEYFFDQVLRNGQRLYLDKANIPYVLSHNPERDLETDARFWNKCIAVAQFNIHAAKDSLQVDVELCKIALLNTACVQIAVGLIRVFLGYSPNEFGLKYLLQLCGHFTVMPSQLFHQQTPEAIRRYKMLCAPTAMLNHWTRLNAADEDFLWLLDACRVFLKLANELATPELERLENKFTKSIPS
jgi:hypothetical protein